MYFYLTGIDYKSASLELREEFYRRKIEISAFWRKQASGRAALLFTCNRIEIYGTAGYPDEAFSDMSRFSAAFEKFAKHAYIKYGRTQVFRHALRLASGLESQLQGETQILSQIKRWAVAEDFPYSLRLFWQEAISLAEDIRAVFGLNDKKTDIASLVFEEIKKQFPGKGNLNILILGTGKIAKLFASQKPDNAKFTFLAHKNFPKAQALAGLSGGAFRPLSELTYILPEADVLISASSSPHYLLDSLDRKVGAAKQLYIYDLAIPRDIHPQVGVTPGITLRNLDELSYLFRQHNQGVSLQVEAASGLIDEAVLASPEVARE